VIRSSSSLAAVWLHAVHPSRYAKGQKQIRWKKHSCFSPARWGLTILKQALVIARKEVKDHSREVRSLWASLVHLLMGPVIVSLVLFSMKNAPAEKLEAVLMGMSSIFILVAAFVGGMNVSMDLLAGERERRSLLPLLLNPVSRVSVVMGKWLANKYVRGLRDDLGYRCVC